MKNTILTSLIAMLIALSLVSCDKDDEPKKVLQADTLANACPFIVRLNVNQHFYALDPTNNIDCTGLITVVDGVPMLNADIAWKGTYLQMDSMIVVKDYQFVPTNKQLDQDAINYSVTYYTITEEVLRDIIAKMKGKGIEPKAFDEDFFSHKGKVYEYNRYENTSSYDIVLDAPISVTIRKNANTQSDFVKGGVQDNKKITLNCTLYYGDAEAGTAFSLNIRDFDWSVFDATDVKADMERTVTYHFKFTDALLESIKTFMADKNVFPVETEFPKE